MSVSTRKTSLPGMALRNAILTVLEAWDHEVIGPGPRMHRQGGAFVEALDVLRRAVAGTVPETKP